MRLFDRLRSQLQSSPTLDAVATPLRELEGRTLALGKELGASARGLAEQVVAPEVLDDLADRAASTRATIEATEHAAASQIAASLQTHLGVEVSPETVVKAGRVVLASVVAMGVAEALSGAGTLGGFEGGGFESGGLEGGHIEPGELALGEPGPGSSGGECPTVLYDGMGNMDGTVTITDGGVATDYV